MNLGTLASGEGNFAKTLREYVLAIERGDGAAWPRFAGFVRAGEPGLDGEHAETYGVACAEIFRRDPTFFLRRYLAHDEPEYALACARRGFAWLPSGFRKVLVKVHRSRLELAVEEGEDEERQQIARFLNVALGVSVKPTLTPGRKEENPPTAG